jgi:hypothetical protein
MNFIGYNLYRSTNGGDFELLEFIPSANDSNYYALPLNASPDLHCYQLTALWLSQNDTCESAPAISFDDPTADSVCVLMVGGEGKAVEHPIIKISPNPFFSTITFKCSFAVPSEVTLSIFNSFGDLVHQVKEYQSFGEHTIIWQPEGLPPGMYFYHLNSFGNSAATGRIIRLN